MFFQFLAPQKLTLELKLLPIMISKIFCLWDEQLTNYDKKKE